MMGEVVTSWVVATIGGATGNVPEILIDYPGIGCRDVTEQPGVNLPTDPPLHIRYIYNVDEATMNQIIADPKYPVGWAK